jgi:hypothetical protein
MQISVADKGELIVSADLKGGHCWFVDSGGASAPCLHTIAHPLRHGASPRHNLKHSPQSSFGSPSRVSS